MPKRIIIGPATYTVQHSHEAIIEYGKRDGTDVWGACQNRISNIIIDEGYPLDRQQVVLFHEILHAIHCVYDMEKLKVDDEHYISVLSAGLIEVLKRNPELAKYLVQNA